jgi:hypothetical protein
MQLLGTTTITTTFYSKVSCDRIEMKPHEQKKKIQNKTKREGKKDDKNQIKRKKYNKTLSQKNKKWTENFF